MNKLKALVIVAGIVSSLMFSNDIYAKEIGSVFMYNGKYLVVQADESIKEEAQDGWLSRDIGNGKTEWYYVANGNRVCGIKSIDGRNEVFDSRGVWQPEGSLGYREYMGKIEAMYNEKLAGNQGFKMSLTEMSLYEKYRLLEDYNKVYNLGDSDVYYTGYSVTDSGIELINPSLTVENAYRDMLSKLDGIETLSNQDKVKRIHDLILDTFSYDYGLTPRGVSDALVNGNKFVCSGYAEAFNKLCSKYGIDSETVVGYANGEAHAWNKVKIDNDWLYVDCTWDDVESNKYAWFLKTQAEFKKTHIAI